jgi:hypothetical protein
MELPTPAPSVSPNSQTSTSDEIGAGQLAGTAQESLTSENEISAASALLPTNPDFPANAVQQTVPVPPQPNIESGSSSMPSFSAPVTGAAAANQPLSSTSNQDLPFASQLSALKETDSFPISAQPVEPAAESLATQSSTLTGASSNEGTNHGTADSVTVDPSGPIPNPASTISTLDASNTSSSSTQSALPQAIDAGESAPIMPQELLPPQGKTELHMASQQSAAAAGTLAVAATGTSSDTASTAASAISAAAVSVPVPSLTETSRTSPEKSKEITNASSVLPMNTSVANDHAGVNAALHSHHFIGQLQNLDNGSMSTVHNSPAPMTSFPSAAPLQSQDSSNVNDTSSQNSLTSTPMPATQLALTDAADVATPGATLVTGSASGLDTAPSSSSRDAQSEKASASNPVSTIAGTSSDPLNPAAGSTAGTPSAVTQVLEIGSSGKSSTAPGSTALPHGATQNSTPNEMLDDGPELSPAMHAWNGGENLQADLSRSPHLVEKLGQSEMNIAMQADALGSVQVRAHLVGDQLGAAITVEHHDVHTMLSNDLPALHQALSDQQFRVANLSVHQAFSSGDAGIGGGKGQQQPQDGPAQRATPCVQSSPDFSAPVNFSTSVDSSESRGAFNSQGRLSVRA